MKRFKQKMMVFMSGRYGVDETYFALFVLCMLTLMINSVVRSGILYFISSVVLVAMLFRFMSRNHAKRRRENQIFLSIWYPIRNWFILQKDKFRDRKTARYRKCNHCRSIIKLPNKKGKHTVVCPKCREKFEVRIL